MIQVDIGKQILTWQVGAQTCCYPISSAKLGVGEQMGSWQTPRGKHVIRAKIGADMPIHTYFIARRPQGILTPELMSQEPEKDWILTRILWLGGREIGINRFGAVDTMRRYIYIHGTNREDLIGTPASHGCIRMKNADIIELFDRVLCGESVEIVENM
jgi:lipoprotein-anchoring transpeptidase ErfK/SrfK